ncbi:MAG: glycosyltransferase family 4 protein [Deltaproteobacteria bacterium]|nr:glycosyltransferase family 4 protein [Deltaproteobacteria bacterium]
MNQPAVPGNRAFLNILAIAPLPFWSEGTETFLFGGSIFFAELLPRLAQLGHTVRVIAEAPPMPADQPRTGLPWTIPNLAVEWFACVYRRGSSVASSFPPEEEHTQVRVIFDRMVRACRPDVVLLGRELHAWYLGDLCQELALPSLLIVHGTPAAAFVRETYPEAVKQELLACFARSSRLVTVAPYLEKIIRSHGVMQVQTIPNVTDTTRFRPLPKDPLLLKELRIAPHQVVVGHISALRPMYRPLDVVHSAERVLKAAPEVVYLIVGQGQCRQEMEEFCRRKGITASFRYLGEVNHQQVLQYLNLMDMVLLPSESDGVPLFAYRETQACGRVLLLSDIPAACEAVVDGETGVLFRLGDMQDLATKTLALIRDASWRRKIGEQARAVAVTQTLDRWVQAYDDVLRRTASYVESPTAES